MPAIPRHLIPRHYVDGDYDTFVRNYMRTEEKKAAAHDQAKRLFLSLLTPEQTKEFAERGYITVRGGTSKKKYFIVQGISGNVWNRNTRGRQTSYCCHMGINAPAFDHMIAQMFHLRFNEEVFLKTAYKSTY